MNITRAHRRRIPLVLMSAAAMTAMTLPAPAQDVLRPVRVRIAGREIRSKTQPVVRQGSVWVPLEALVLLNAEGKLNSAGNSLQVVLGPDNRTAAVPAATINGTPMVELNALASLVDGVVERQEIAADGRRGPIPPGPVAFLLAKVRSISFEDGAPRAITSFPTPSIRALTATAPVRGSLDIVGAKLMPDTVLPPEREEGRKTLFSAKQIGPDTVRILLELPTPVTTPAPGRQNRPEGHDRVLTLDEVIRRVDRLYPKLTGADFERRAAGARTVAAQGAFDTNLRVNNGFEQYNSSGKLKEFNTTSVTAEVLTRQGVSFFASGLLNGGALKSPLSTTGGVGVYGIGARLPLMRGLGINTRAAAERQAKIGEKSADAAFFTTRLDAIASAANQYWNWVAASWRVKVADDLLAVAQVRAQQITDEVKAGIRQGIDQFEAEAEVRRRQEGVAKAERDVQKESFKLGLYLWENGGDRSDYPEIDMAPPVIPPPTEMDAARVREGRDQALRQRPELKLVTLAREIVRVDRDLARNDTMPNVDLLVNPAADTGFNAVGPQMKYGLSFSLPLQRRSAQGKLDEAGLKMQKIDQEERLLKQQVQVEVDDAVSAINAAYQRYLAAVQELQALRTLEQGERDRLALGEGTLFLVNQRERATAEAAVKVINIQAEYEQARAAFRAATAGF